MKIIITAAAALFALTANAFSLIDWVRQESHNKMSHDEAYRIVKTAKKMAKRQRLDPVLVLAVMKQESGFRNKVTSSKGAKGIMQVIPKWHDEKIKGRSLHSLEVGVEVGTLVLAEYIEAANGDIKRALRKYSGGSRSYASSVLGYRARMILETRDGLRYASNGRI